MHRHVLTIRALGEDTCWLLVQQAIGIPDAKKLSDFLSNKVALLMFAKPSLPERLCVTGAVRQMGGTTIYQGDDGGIWRKEVGTFQKHLLPIFGYYLDCLYIYDVPISSLDMDTVMAVLPVINAGCADSHPAHALADIALMSRRNRKNEFIRAAWIGCDNGTLHSLIEASAWFPFSMRISLPPHIDTSHIRKRIGELKTDIGFANDPEEAVKGVNYIYAGCHGGLSASELEKWTISPALVRHAASNVKLMLSASPIRAIPISPEILASRTSLLSYQAEYRLRVHKRILHWIFENEE